MTEEVLVFPSSVLEAVLPGFTGALVGEPVKAAVEQIMNPDNLSFHPRPAAEQDPTLKQVIPYIVVRNGTKVLAYQRTKKGGESRLYGKWSIGFGGHINPHDGGGGIAYEKCFWRELAEELALVQQPGEVMPTPAALLYESDTEVGRVHFGVVHILDVSDSFNWTPEVDASVANVRWIETPDLMPDAFEAWSQMVITEVLKS